MSEIYPPAWDEPLWDTPAEETGDPDVHATMIDAGGLLQELRDRLREDLIGCLAEGGGTAAHVRICLETRLQEEEAEYRGLVDQLRHRLWQDASAGLAGAESLAREAGVPLPRGPELPPQPRPPAAPPAAPLFPPLPPTGAPGWWHGYPAGTVFSGPGNQCTLITQSGPTPIPCLWAPPPPPPPPVIFPPPADVIPPPGGWPIPPGGGGVCPPPVINIPPCPPAPPTGGTCPPLPPIPPCPPANIQNVCPPIPPCPPAQIQVNPPPCPPPKIENIISAPAPNIIINQPPPPAPITCPPIRDIQNIINVPPSNPPDVTVTSTCTLPDEVSIRIREWPSPPKTPPGGWEGRGAIPSWCDVGVCAHADQIVRGIRVFSTPITTLLKAFTAAPFVGGIFETVLEGLQNAADWIVSSTGCDIAALPWLVIARGVAGFIQTWLGVDLSEATQTMTYWVNYACPTRIPSVSDATEAYLRGTITREVWECWLRANGQCVAPYERVMWARRSRITPDQAAELWQQQRLSEEELQDILRFHAIMDRRDVANYKEMQRRIPPPSDMVRFGMREVFDGETASKWGYDEELDESPAYLAWMERLGYGWYDPPPGDTRSGLTSWAQAYWRAGWEVFSPTQGYIALQRFRPNRLSRYNKDVPTLKPFGLDEARALLKVKDYPRPVRDWLIASSYRLPGQIDLRRMWQYGIIDDIGELAERYRDLGYAEVDAKEKARLTDEQVRRTNKAPLLALGRSKILEARRVGAITEPDALALLKELGLSDGEAQQALSILQLELQVDLVRRSVASARARFLRGFWSRSEARSGLQRIGVVSDRVDQLLALWQLELDDRRRYLSAGQILAAYVDRLASASDTEVYLGNLGYEGYEIGTLMLQSNLKQLDKLEKAVEKGARREKQRRQELLRIQREAERLIERARAALARHSSPAYLTRWLRSGRIAPDDALRRLQVLGWPLEDAQRHVDEALNSPPEGRKSNGPPTPPPK